MTYFPAPVRTLIGFLGFCIFMACSADKRNVRAYYFPAEALKRGQVYAYQVRQNDAEATEYWYYRGFVRDSGVFLSATFYDQQFQIGQIVREQIKEEGAFARTYMLYEPDSSGTEEGGQKQSAALIESPLIFPFNISEGADTRAFRLFYNPPGDPGSTVYVNRKRRYTGEAPAFIFKGKSLSCIRFALDETISYDERNGNDVVVRGEEWYAKGLGLVWYKKTYGAGEFTIEGKLIELFPMSELERRAAAYFGE